MMHICIYIYDDDDNADDAVCFDRRDTSQIKDTS